jgi:hypothetical protein
VKSPLIYSLVLACLSFAAAARAELQWKRQRLHLQPVPGASDATGVFEFVNTGTAPVRVREVRSGCGCTATSLDQEVVEPGATGKVQAVYHVGNRRGKQSVGITVVAEEPEVRTYDLVVEVEIKDFVTLSPRLLYWRVGEEAVPKVVHAALAEGLRLIDVESASDEFSVELQPGDNATLQLQVTPRDTWAKRSGSLVVKVAHGDQPPIEARIALRVL